MVQYRCPVFKGFVICVSGMASDDRNNVRRLVEQNGQLTLFNNIYNNNNNNNNNNDNNDNNREFLFSCIFKT